MGKGSHVSKKNQYKEMGNFKFQYTLLRKASPLLLNISSFSSSVQFKEIYFNFSIYFRSKRVRLVYCYSVCLCDLLLVAVIDCEMVYLLGGNDDPSGSTCLHFRGVE